MTNVIVWAVLAYLLLSLSLSALAGRGGDRAGHRRLR